MRQQSLFATLALTTALIAPQVNAKEVHVFGPSCPFQFYSR
jgi:hypothetical protein